MPQKAKLDTEYDRANVPPYNGNDPPPAPGSLKRSLFPTLLNEVQNKGTQGVRARYGAELPPIISIVRYPGRPVISVPEKLLRILRFRAAKGKPAANLGSTLPPTQPSLLFFFSGKANSPLQLDRRSLHIFFGSKSLVGSGVQSCELKNFLVVLQSPFRRLHKQIGWVYRTICSACLIESFCGAGFSC